MLAACWLGGETLGWTGSAGAFCWAAGWAPRLARGVGSAADRSQGLLGRDGRPCRALLLCSNQCRKGAAGSSLATQACNGEPAPSNSHCPASVISGCSSPDPAQVPPRSSFPPLAVRSSSSTVSEQHGSSAALPDPSVPPLGWLPGAASRGSACGSLHVLCVPPDCMRTSEGELCRFPPPPASAAAAAGAAWAPAVGAWASPPCCCNYATAGINGWLPSSRQGAVVPAAGRLSAAARR